MPSITSRGLYRITSGSCLLLGVGASPLVAQYASPLGPGTLVRVSHTDSCCRSPRVGTLVAVSADSVVIHERGAQNARVALRRGNVTALEAGRDVGSRAWRGAGLGFLIGGGVGAAVMLAGDCEDDAICHSFKPVWALAGGGLGGLAGLVVGGLIGSQIRNVVWHSVPIPSQVGFGPNEDGRAGLRLTVSF